MTRLRRNLARSKNYCILLSFVIPKEASYSASQNLV